MARRWKFLAQIHKPLAQFHGREGVYSSGIEFGNDARVCGFGHPEAIPHGNVEPSKPASSTVGRSGNEARRDLAVTA